MNKKILVAMSGGVDSSVAAALLKNQGYDVIGVFIFFEPREKTKNNPKSCCSIQSLQTAKRVAQILDIPFYTLNMTVNFKKIVIDDFINEYKIGNTPNPCIRCNKYLKFGKLLDYAKKLGCDYLATGHYARVVTPAFRPDLSELKLGATNKNKKYKLITAKDKNKDQSYFLYELTQKKLKHILFPLGNYKKEKVKKLAKKFDLPVYNKKESSDVCFVNTNLREYLSSRIRTSKGDIIDTHGKKIGQHIGLPFYTLGQRQGIKTGGTGPYYVIKKDFNKNQLIVTNNPRDPKLFLDKLFVKNINWLSGQEPKLPFNCLARHRYQTILSKVSIQKNDHLNSHLNGYIIKYKKPQRAITPGQSIVFYKPLKKWFNQDYEVLGGGIITN